VPDPTRIVLCDIALTASTLSKSFANELSKVFNIDEDPQVEELEKTLREKWDSS